MDEGTKPEGFGTQDQSRRGDRGGFTILELMMVVSVIVVALLAMSHTIVSSMKLTNVNRESGFATDGLRDMVERMQGERDFGNIFALYNSNPLDDPGVAGSAPGPNFAVPGLEAAPGDPDGFVGEIQFPTIGAQLREDLADPSFGTPRDLNADGFVDSVDHATNYRVLPVVLRVRWKGLGPEREIVIRTLFADR